MSRSKSIADKTILVASCSIDKPTWQPVVDILTKRGHDVIVYEADKVANASVLFGIVIGKDTLYVDYGKRRIVLETIAAAWYRRPMIFNEDITLKQQGIDPERNVLQQALWNEISEPTWLNSFENIQHAERKISQLVLAQKLGFVIPTTLVTNTWSAFANELPKEIIFKPSYGTYYGGSGPNILHTTSLTNTPQGLPMHTSPFPGLWQPYLQKAREWRIAIIGECSFDAAIYTDDIAKVDWRSHQGYENRVIFKAEAFPDKEKKLCFEYLRHMKLRFGCFDFVEDQDGVITFLECNANGQYGWLEDELGFPISEAIADTLEDITKHTRPTA